MNSASAVIICFAYILGLLFTALPGGGYGVLGLGIVAALVVLLPLPGGSRGWKSPSKALVWLLAGFIGLAASFYLQWYTPKPAANDISRFVGSSDTTNMQQLVKVWGTVKSVPRVTRSEKGQFWLEATKLEILPDPKAGSESQGNQPVSGNLYVTVPLLQATGRHPGQVVAVTGKLYEPQGPSIPGGFDFKAYLAKDGCFAGLAGRQVDPQEGNSQEVWGLWQVRRRILQSQARWLGVPAGPLLTGMVLGGRGVDLPNQVKDDFVQVGLAHVLAASGFHVSLLVRLVLELTKRFSPRVQFGFGVSALAVYVGLTGLQASVLRAALMGLGALVGLLYERQVKPLASLLIAAVVLLLFNPLWIWDVGFQLSFLATLGLLVTVPPMMKRLDWLPTPLASAIAVPLAAMVWTLPLQLQVFSQLPPYSIVVNAITSIIISPITIGGFISGVAALVWPVAGSALAWLLYYPLQLLMAMVQFFSELPGSAVATGTLSLIQLLLLYGAVVMVWLVPWWHQGRRWVLIMLFAVGLVVVPVLQARATIFQVTILDAGGATVLVAEDKGEVTLMSSGDENTALYAVMPFLRQQAINQIDWGIAPTGIGPRSGWYLLLNKLGVTNLASPQPPSASLQSVLDEMPIAYQKLEMGKEAQFGLVGVKLVSDTLPVMQLQIGDKSWLWLGNLNISEQSKLVQGGNLPQADVLWWSGNQLAIELLEVVAPSVAIASNSPDVETLGRVGTVSSMIYSTAEEAVITWTPDGGFATNLEKMENSDPLF
ncbi:MAG TPA: ComEC/Rec2 family competence protein [Oscillatoriaceae cyanobacterium M33_DOE_052]|uniref:ComEC/Rec2 family competence protein n=1 Tax=Planktothricoides sp. SpSt-374 TaxID=2282167 RepID=A0A7C3VIW7_9CYAN|nr:ComEC/Rec2 family competence protein [Oscillatoriaceae cyanobacterium M33_DOE_052]